MNVKMGYALTDAIIDRDKGPVGRQTLLDSAREQLGVAEERKDKGRRQIGQRFVMISRHQQAVSWKKGTMIEKRQGDLVLKHHVALEVATDDLAKDAMY